MSLREYRKRRDFRITSEPRAARSRKKAKPLIFVIQEHHARRLHWDFRLEWEGVLKSWAVTREPSLDPAIRRLAIQTEDHPYEYARFSGRIPKGQYGAGQVKIWDRGTYVVQIPLESSIGKGVVEVYLRGKKLRGRFILILLRENQWLFFKGKPKQVRLHVARIA